MRSPCAHPGVSVSSGAQRFLCALLCGRVIYQHVEDGALACTQMPYVNERRGCFAPGRGLLRVVLEVHWF